MTSTMQPAQPTNFMWQGQQQILPFQQTSLQFQQQPLATNWLGSGTNWLGSGIFGQQGLYGPTPNTWYNQSSALYGGLFAGQTMGGLWGQQPVMGQGLYGLYGQAAFPSAFPSTFPQGGLYSGLYGPTPSPWFNQTQTALYGGMYGQGLYGAIYGQQGLYGALYGQGMWGQQPIYQQPQFPAFPGFPAYNQTYNPWGQNPWGQTPYPFQYPATGIYGQQTGPQIPSVVPPQLTGGLTVAIGAPVPTSYGNIGAPSAQFLPSVSYQQQLQQWLAQQQQATGSTPAPTNIDWANFQGNWGNIPAGNPYVNTYPYGNGFQMPQQYQFYGYGR